MAGIRDKFLLGIDHLLDRSGQPAGERTSGDRKKKYSDKQQTATDIQSWQSRAKCRRATDQDEIAFAGIVLVFVEIGILQKVHAATLICSNHAFSIF